ncbi:alpha-d-galacturonidase [Pedobacter immunditicola]|uniref:alpha-d-galacturonidase n=1 Tax=Pedobacter immunditicola TaxID=3133440 RepID=UPI0030B5AAB4
MRNFQIFIFLAFLLPIFSQASIVDKSKVQTILIPVGNNPRIKFGAERISKALKLLGYTSKIIQQNTVPSIKGLIVITTTADQLSTNARLSPQQKSQTKSLGKEAFSIAYNDRNNLVIVGSDASGALYGCMELLDQIKTSGKLPEKIAITDQPEMVLRGTAIGLQKPDYLPGHDIYEYPYTPESFPWFYDKDLWLDYLDSMVENRYNSLYLWNGHPFSSLVKLKDYPYALEVDEETFKKNEEMFRFLTTEADKRGIWVIQMFYNILIPKPFAEKHNLKTQDRNRPITPLIADYTRKSIAAFVEKYPNVGLLITLGEAMEGTGQDDVDWFTKTIIPGVQDGLKAIGITTEPPLVLRAHDSDAPRVMKSALPLYKNLYTMAKYNGEALTTYTPRGSWAELHRTLSAIGTVHIENVHILANLEPFRYGSADFIQKSVKAMHEVYGARGLHLYPQASYWDWPYTADKVEGRLLQVDRDWIWYKAWARYSWNSKRERPAEIDYWGNELASKYGTDLNGGKAILNAYEESGEISPKLLRRYGITDGNRQTLTLGMLMTQLINPFRYGLFTMLYESEAPEGEMIIEYAEKEWKKQGHIGETPVQVAREVIEHGKKAVESINQAAASVTKDKEEFRMLKNDMYCYDAMANSYAEKVKAALWILRYKYSNDIADLDKAVPFLQNSLDHYAKLVKLTENDYLYANSMQTKQRKIPMRGVDKTFIHWKEMLPVFTKELAHFKRSIDSLKAAGSTKAAVIKPFKNVEVTMLSPYDGYYNLQKGISVFKDTVSQVKDITDQLVGLKGIKFTKNAQVKEGTTLRFKNKQPVKLLIGFFNQQNPGYLAAPVLEIDASANNYGQAETKILNAIMVNDVPVNVHAYSFDAGTHTLNLGKGACMLLGFIDDKQEMRIYNAGLDGRGRDIDWLFE